MNKESDIYIERFKISYMKATLFKQAHNASLLLIGIFFLSGLILDLSSQSPPLEPTALFDRSEVILVWDEGTTNGAKVVEQNMKLKFNYQGVDEGDRLLGAEKVVSDNSWSYSKRQIDLLAGDFNGDNMADYLYSLTGRADTLHLVLARRGKTLNYTYKHVYKHEGKVLLGKNLILGDLDGDGLNEFVVGFRPFGEDVAHVAVFGFDSNFEIVLLDVIEAGVSVDDFLVDLGDLDGDGDDELVMGYFELGSEEDYFLQVYDFGTDFRPVKKEALKLDLLFGAEEFGGKALAAVDFDNDGLDELVIGFTINTGDAPNNPDTYLYTAAVMDNPDTGSEDPLEMIRFYKDSYVSGIYSYNSSWHILLKSGDLNGDGKLEVLLGCNSGVRIFQGAADDRIEYYSQSSVNGFADDLPSVNYFDVADITGDDRDDIIAVNHYFDKGPVGDQGFSWSMYQFDSNLRTTRIERANQKNVIDNGGGGGMHETHFAVAMSDFDGDLFRIGDYTSQGCFTNVVKPLTVLNTPPVHIDYIDGFLHDVNECFGQNDCASSVQKSNEQFIQDEFSIESSSRGDWGYQAEYTLGINQNLGGLGGVAMSPVELSSIFGGDLEELVYDQNTTSIGKTTSRTFFQTASMDRRFSRDDAILTIVSDYERWEYPVYNEYDEMLGEIVILIPQTTNEENWLRGRQSLEVAGMVQLHEPGNLLSYRKFVESEEDLMETNPDIREIISIANEHELDLNSTFTESITWGSEFEGSNVSVENTVETQPSGGFNILGFELRRQDESVAEEELIISHVHRAGKNLGIEVYGSSLAANSYEYKVKPYYYWSRNGALVVDYMIDLSAGSFWQDNYSLQDPGFILPNRLDSLKAKNEIDKITDLDEYIKTPSILFEPTIPVNGDTVRVTTIVHNLSISSTSDPVELSFFLGDPEKGGSRISDVEGNFLFATPSTIEDQNFAIVEFDWLADFTRGDRLYAVIDPYQKLVENKLDNNKAWAPVQRFAACGQGPLSDQVPLQAITMEERFTFYPNPARDHINLSYAGPDISGVVVTITDMSGKIYLNETRSYLHMDYRSTLAIDGLPKGVYILSFSTRNYIQHNKLLIE
jgi:Secretion system C-terminal sorting domain